MICQFPAVPRERLRIMPVGGIADIVIIYRRSVIAREHIAPRAGLYALLHYLRRRLINFNTFVEIVHMQHSAKVFNLIVC